MAHLLVLVGLAVFLAGNVTIIHGCPRLRSTLARVQTAELRKAADMFCLFLGEVPTDLNALSGSPSDMEGPLGDGSEVTVDPWGRPWIYEATGKCSVRIRSLGADGLPGGTGEDADLSSDDP